MLTFLYTIGRFFRALRNGMREPEFRALFFLTLLMFFLGTLFYMRAEGWNWLDAFYFSVMTLATVGYGDLSPTTPASKLFTIFYVLIGIGIMVAFIERLAVTALKTRIRTPGPKAKDESPSTTPDAADPSA